MKHIKFISTFAAAAMLAVLMMFTGCKKEEATISGITISSSAETVKVGSTVTLSYTCEPTEAKAESAVWSSSSEAVAKVDQNGVVTGVAAGTATITIKVNGQFTATCAVTVEVTNPVVTTAAKVVSTSGGYKFAYSITKNKDASKVRYIFSLLDEVADLSDDDLIKYIGKYGLETTEDVPETELTYASAWVRLTVAAIPYDNTGNAGALSKSIATPELPPVTAITISSSSESLKVGSTVALSYTYEPAKAKVESAVWSSSSAAVAKVDQNGLVTAVSAGTATITITVNGKFTKTCEVTVTKSISDFSQPSNCYIVSEAGTYRFKAVQGNSNDPVGEVKCVKVLWETFEMEGAPSTSNFIQPYLIQGDDYIYFSVNSPFIEGNAVIAAYSDADGKDGNVLWSWHIWLTKSEIKTVTVQDTLTKVTYTLMDRNIGANSVSEFNAASIGTVYQWGRKDAYPGQDYNNGLRVMYRSSAQDVVSRTLENCTEVNNIANSIANPMTVYKQDYSKTGKGNYSWLTTDYTQWNADEIKNLWSANGTKSKYDPCPAGYRVAPKEAFDAVKTQLKTAKMLMDNSYVVDPSISSKWQEKYRAQNEVKVKFRGGQFGNAYFMVTGDIGHTLNNSNGISTLQPSAESWSSTLDDFVSYSSASYFRAFSVKINASFPSTTSPVEDFYMSVNSKNGLNLAYELPVRCIKM